MSKMAIWMLAGLCLGAPAFYAEANSDLDRRAHGPVNAAPGANSGRPGAPAQSMDFDAAAALKEAARLNEFAAAELAQGRLNEAEADFRKLVALEAQIWGAEAAIRLPNLELLAALQLDLRRFDDSAASYQEILRVCDASNESEFRALEPLRWLAALSLSRRDLVNAERYWSRSVDLHAQALGADHPLTIAARTELRAMRTRRAGKVADAVVGSSSSFNEVQAESALDRLSGPARRAARSSLVDTVGEVMRRRLAGFAQISKNITAEHQAVWEDQGFAQLALGRPARALGSYQSALRIATARVGLRDPGLRPLLELNVLSARHAGSDSVARAVQQRLALLELP